MNLNLSNGIFQLWRPREGKDHFNIEKNKIKQLNLSPCPPAKKLIIKNIYIFKFSNIYIYIYIQVFPSFALSKYFLLLL